MALPPNALRQLEVLRSAEDDSIKGSLFGLLNCTRTPMGARRMQHWVAHPLCDLRLIEVRAPARPAALTTTALTF
eukprot:7917930-Pyramimonas_sp.AAC.1